MTKLAIVKDTLAFSGSTWIVQTLTFLLAIYIRHALGPEAMGVWALLQIFLNYIGCGNLGMANTVMREIPLLRGGGKKEEIGKIQNVGFSYITIVNVLTSLLLVLAAFIWSGRLSSLMFYGLLALACINLLQRANNYRVQLLYADKEFLVISKFRIYSALVNGGLTAVLTWRYRLYGLYAATFLSFLYNVVFLETHAKTRFRWVWDGKEMRRLLRFGIPLFILGLVTTFFQSLDKLAIGKFLGLKALGVYTIATLAGGYIFMLPNVFQTVLLPRTFERFGEKGNEKGRENYSLVPGRLMAVYFSLGIGMAWIAGPYLCRAFLPKYLDGIPALKALIFGYAFLALAQQMGHVLLGYGRHLRMLPVVAVLAAGVWAASCAVVSLGGGIFALAFLSTAFYLVYYVFSAFFALGPLGGVKKFREQMVLTFAPLFYGFLVLGTLDRFWPLDSLALVLMKMALYFLFWVVFLKMLEGKLGVMAMAKGLWVSWREGRGARLSPLLGRVVQFAGEDPVTGESDGNAGSYDSVAVEKKTKV